MFQGWTGELFGNADNPCSTCRTYIARVFATEFGGFFNYVNSLRLNYADTYRKEHPDAKLSEVISESGFGSRTTYYKVRKQLEES